MNTYTHEDLKSMAEDVKLARFLRDIYKWEDDYSISYAARKILWENKLTGKEQDPKWLEKYQEQMVRTVQAVLRLWSYGYSEVELEAECAEDVAEDKDELLGRLTAWNHHITQGVGSTFLTISVWEPGKDPKSAYRYYLVKE